MAQLRMMHLFKTLTKSLVALLPVFSAASLCAEYADTWGPEVGSTLPAFELADSTGELRDLSSLAGPSGLIFFFTRSADW